MPYKTKQQIAALLREQKKRAKVSTPVIGKSTLVEDSLVLISGVANGTDYAAMEDTSEWKVKIKEEIDEIQHEPINIPYDGAFGDELENCYSESGKFGEVLGYDQPMIAPKIEPGTWNAGSEKRDDILASSQPIAKPECSQKKIQQRCRFCLRVLNEKIKMQCKPGADQINRKKMEFALSIKLTVKPLCCSSCWQMIELFDSFKRSCHMAILKPEELLGSTKTVPVVKISKISKGSDLHKAAANSNNTKSSSWMVSIPIKRCSQLMAPKSKSLTCKQCSKNFATLNNFLSHKRSCLGYACHMCPAVLDTRQDLRSHFETEHSDPSPFKCRNKGCDRKFSLYEALLTHEQSCNFDCKICGKTAINEKAALAHKRTHMQPRFECNVCNTKFLDRKTLRTHWTKHFRKDSATANAEKQNENEATSSITTVDLTVSESPSERVDQSAAGASSPPPKADASKTFPCSQCPAVFDEKADWQTHMNRHAGKPSFFCPKPNCKMGFFTQSCLQKHSLLHSQKPSFICTICNAALKSTYTLKEHMASHQEPTLQCPNCDKKFHTRPLLRKHLTVHYGERKFQCKVCEKTFNSREANRIHQRTHPNENPWACHICDERFPYNCRLKAHLARDHPEQLAPK